MQFPQFHLQQTGNLTFLEYNERLNELDQIEERKRQRVLAEAGSVKEHTGVKLANYIKGQTLRLQEWRESAGTEEQGISC